MKPIVGILMRCLLFTSFIAGGMSYSSVAVEKISRDFCLWKDKNIRPEQIEDENSEKESKLKSYAEVISKNAKTQKGVFKIHCVKNDFYFEIPDSLMKRDFLLVNKISKVSSEVNHLGFNKGMNYQNLMIQFEVDTLLRKIWVKTYQPNYESPKEDAITNSVANNHIPSVRESFDLACLGKDSASYVFKVNKVFDGSEKSLNDLFGILGISSSAINHLSHISQIKNFPKNALVKALLTTKAEGITVSVEATSNLVLLPKTPMKPRFADRRIGFFTSKRFYFNDKQQKLEERELVNRWRLEPKDEDMEKYLKGELVEPKKPIVYYLDPSTPLQWRQAIKDGIADWQVAFEAAGFKNAILAKDAPENNPDFDGDDVRYSMITYAASSQANAMGPAVTDPRSGEVIEADVMWWHNVMTALHSWVRVQTGAIDEKARGNQFADEHMAHAIRFVSSHEVGHTLGLMHNMGASYAYPVDSLRSPGFTKRMGGTASSIMDYARFNYVAQPEDGVKHISPQIGVYDKYAINWAYRWFNTETAWEELPILNEMIRKHENDPLYHYGPQQDSKNIVDPSAQSEDLGDDAVKAGLYGLKNLERISKEVENWACEEGKGYEEAGKLMMGIIGQWFTYANHVVANIGGIYLDQPVYGENKAAYTNVSKKKQQEAVRYLLNHVFNLPNWLQQAKIYEKTYPIKESVVGDIEYAPTTLFRDLHARIFFLLLQKERLLRMLENEAANGNEAYKLADLMSDLHQGIFKKTIKGKNLGVYDRQNQKNFVDALIISQNKTLEKSRKKNLYHDQTYSQDLPLFYACKQQEFHLNQSCGANHYGEKNFKRNLLYATMNRVSDEVSVKRGELLKIRNLLKKKRNTGDETTRFHYQDLLLRIEEALSLNRF